MGGDVPPRVQDTAVLAIRRGLGSGEYKVTMLTNNVPYTIVYVLKE